LRAFLEIPVLALRACQKRQAGAESEIGGYPGNAGNFNDKK
jgi:hypothetical protein